MRADLSILSLPLKVYLCWELGLAPPETLRHGFRRWHASWRPSTPWETRTPRKCMQTPGKGGPCCYCCATRCKLQPVHSVGLTGQRLLSRRAPFLGNPTVARAPEEAGARRAPPRAEGRGFGCRMFTVWGLGFKVGVSGILRVSDGFESLGDFSYVVLEFGVVRAGILVPTASIPFKPYNLQVT